MNSANVGPYGDAITQELIPAVRSSFAGLDRDGHVQPMAEAREDGGAGIPGLLPEFYNGTWALCPDPVDFHAYQVANLYEDENAYTRKGPFTTIEIPSAAWRSAT